ncbi:MAG: iron ABC transporter permease [Paramuribaculum sp.]|nr:iron ABC transporter permease [Paramuribaculum sp.]
MPSRSPNTSQTRHRRQISVMWILTISSLLLAAGCLTTGSVDIPLDQIWASLSGGELERETWRVIVLETRLPMLITAAVAGAALSIAGLLLQTCFDNPLAGPSILGISTGASLGVAVVMLAGGSLLGAGWNQYAGSIIGALAGSFAVMLLLLFFARLIHSGVMILIVGVLVGYFASSAISLLNFFATQEGVHSYVIWGLGNFSGSSLGRTSVFASLTLPVIGLSMLFVKPLNALLLGARYAESLGVGIDSLRRRLLIISGVLTAFVTAFCGPIGFIGLIVPHIARIALHTSNHSILLPATALTGAAVGLLCAFISALPSASGLIPINAITPIIGVPVIIYTILFRKRLYYFS